MVVCVCARITQYHISVNQVTFSTGQAIVTVVDDDSIGVRLEQSVYSVTEDVNFINLCVSIEGHFSVDVPVTVSTEAVTAEGEAAIS